MSLTAKILGFLNLIAAGALIYLAARDYYARVEWAHYLDVELAEQRDGVGTGQLLAQLQKVKPEDYQRIDSTLQSEYARRREAGIAMNAPYQNQPQAPEAQALAKQLGPADFRRLLEEYARFTQPRLGEEEQRLIATRDSLLRVQADLQRQIADQEGRVRRAQERLDSEKAITARIQAENAERQKEIASLNAEVEEALAARNLAQNRERDLKEQLAKTRQRIEAMSRQNQALADQIHRLEGVAASTGK